VVSLPWVGWTLLTDSGRFTTVGHQYSLVAAAPVFFGVAYGLIRVPVGEPPPATAHAPEPTPSFHSSPRRGSRAIRAVALVAVAVILVANVLLLPIVPVLSDAGISLNGPFQAGYQNHPLTILPGFSYVEDLISEIPHNSVVTAPSQVFPLIASLPNAFVLNPSPPHQNYGVLPINASAGPEYVIMYPAFLSLWRGALKTNLSDPAMYGVRSYLTSTAIGPLLLYERGYTAPAELIGPGFGPVNATYTPRDGLTAGPIGAVVANSTAPSRSVIETAPGAGREGGLWTSPDTLLPPGNYTVGALVAATPPNATYAHKGVVLRIEVSGFGLTSLNITYDLDAFAVGNWTLLSFTLELPSPVVNVVVNGFLEDGEVGLAVGAVTIVAQSPG